MASRDVILAFADDFLEIASYPDHCPVGLQVTGAEEVTKIACGVSASRELFAGAASAGAELVLVHHGLFWDRDPRVIDATMRGRLERLFQADLTLAAYHLALDAHPEIGNNALLARELGIEPDRRFAGVGFGGSLTEPTDVTDFVRRVRDLLGQEPLVFPYGPPRIERVAVCSGGAARQLGDAAAEGYDCFLTGEAAEPTKYLALETGLHFIAGGHYATETLGVRALAARLGDEFGLGWEFVELPNPV